MGKTFKVLIVEDNHPLEENIRDILEINGYAVDSAPHGKDAIISVQNGHYDMVIVDVQLSDITGTELVENIAAISPATRYIYITGHATLDSTIRAIKQKNVVSYEVKPLDIDHLLLTIQQAKITIETEAALKESEEWLRQSQEAGHVGSWHWYPDTGKLFWSEEIYRILGFAPGEISPTYEFFLEKVHPDDKIFFEKIVNESLQRKHPFNIEYRIIRKDGSERIAHAIGKIHFNGDGKPEKMFGIFQDITERKKTEESLKKLNAELEQRVNERTRELQEKHQILRQELASRRMIEEAIKGKNEQIQLLLNSTGEAIYGLDTEGCCTFVNNSFLALLGYNDANQLIGKKMHDVIHYKYIDNTPYPEEDCKIYQAFQKGKGTHIDNEVFWKSDGSCIPIEYMSYPIYKDNTIIGSVVTFSDITKRKKTEEELTKHRERLEELVSERTAELKKTNDGLQREIIEHRQTEEKLRKSEEKYRRLVEGLQDNYFFFTRDANGAFTYISPSIQNILGYTPDEFHACYLECLTGHPANNDARQRSELNLKGIKQPPYDIEIYHKNGTVRILQLQEAPIFDADKNVISIEGIARDITERKTFESQLVFLADLDSLTRLFNRRRFKEELERCLLEAQRNHTKGALLFLDLDNFKYVNDTLGHQYGDELLIKLSDILKERIRQTDILARLGGDEFAIILPHTEEEKARFISKQLLELTRNNLALDTLNPLHITVSIGIAIFPTHGDNAETLLANADLAMYHAKEEGRNRDCIFSLKHKIDIETQHDWKQRIRNALKQNNFVLHLQPIVSIKDNTIAGYEALLRLTEANKELVPPLKFLPIAERFGIIQEIDRWVVANAMSIMQELQLHEKNLFLEINLSGKAFSDNELLSIIRKEIDKNSINPKTLIFEITETAIIENMSKAQYFIAALKSIGCRFSLDDFGSGFSSFNYLKHLPVDYLKIDGSFIHNLSYSSVDQHLVTGMVEVARGLKKLTVAEFVETKETFQLLQKIGVDYAQGHYFGKPLPVNEIVHD